VVTATAVQSSTTRGGSWVRRRRFARHVRRMTCGSIALSAGVLFVGDPGRFASAAETKSGDVSVRSGLSLTPVASNEPLATAALRRRRVPRGVRRRLTSFEGAGDLEGCGLPENWGVDDSVEDPPTPPIIRPMIQFAVEGDFLSSVEESHPPWRIEYGDRATICVGNFRRTEPVMVSVMQPDGVLVQRSLRHATDRYRTPGLWSWEWFISPRLPLGTYRVLAQQGTLTASASFRFRRPARRAIGAARLARWGDTVEIFLIHFTPRRRQRLLFYYRPFTGGRTGIGGYPSMEFVTWVSVPLDGQGDGTYRFRAAGDRPGRYIAVDRPRFQVNFRGPALQGHSFEIRRGR
jgi:hypothetical protein